MGICAVFGAGAVKAEFHIFGVHGCAVMKQHVVMQRKGIDQPIVGNIPRGRKARDDRSVRGKPRQAFEDIGIQHRIDGPGSAARWVKVWRFKLNADGDVGLCRGGRGRNGQGCKDGYNAHWYSPLSVRFGQGPTKPPGTAP